MVDVTSVSTADTTPGNNASFSGTSVLGTGLVSTADDSFRNLASFLAKWWNDFGAVNTVGGTANAITVTTLTIYGAFKNGMVIAFKNTAGPNTTATTLNLDALGAKAIRLQGDSALVGGEMLANGIYLLRYDTAYNSAAGAWVLLNPFAASNTTSNAPFINFAIGTPSVAASALTIPFNGVDGNAFSATDIGYVSFRSATAGSGAIAQLALTSAQSLVVPSGASLGSVNAVATTYALAAFNNAGAIIYGIINPTSFPLVDGIATTTLLSGSSTSAGVWYTTTALTSKAYTIIGYFTATEATAGTWATAPSAVQVAPAPATNNAFSVSGTWTPNDQSGASLTFTSVTAKYVKVGKVVTCWFRLTFPSTASGSAVSFGGLPFTTDNSAGLTAGTIATTVASPNGSLTAIVTANSTIFSAVTGSSVSNPTNANLSLATVIGQLTYLAA